MELHTASEAVSLARQLEEEAASFYREAAARFSQHGEAFEAFAAENGKHATQIQRVYFGVITDAIEGGYAFNLDPDRYVIDAGVPEAAADALGRAAAIEEATILFYTEAADQSRPLMADLPRAFDQVARKHSRRKEALEGMTSSA
jgi:rubrerythrin